MKAGSRASRLFPTTEQIHEAFEYRDGILYWRYRKYRPDFEGKVAGYLHSNGYYAVGILSQRQYVHRLVFAMFHGRVPEYIDHIDLDKKNNKIENLREATHAQNLCNTNAWNKSGLKGCYYSQRSKRWSCNINHNGKCVYIGSYGTAEEAFAAYIEKAKEVQGEFVPLSVLRGQKNA